MPRGKLNLIFTPDYVPEGWIKSVDTTFRLTKKPEWFDIPLVAKFIKEVDGAEVLFQEALKDRFGHGVSTERLSTGCKTLICMLMLENRKYKSCQYGDNCVPLLNDILETGKSIDIFVTSSPIPMEDVIPESDILVNGKPFPGWDAFYDYYIEFCQTLEAMELAVREAFAEDERRAGHLVYDSPLAEKVRNEWKRGEAFARLLAYP